MRSVRLSRALVAKDSQVDGGAGPDIKLVAGLGHVHVISDTGCVASFVLAQRPQSCVTVGSKDVELYIKYSQ